MASTVTLTTRVVITAVSIGGSSVAKTFENVLFLEFNYFKGTVCIKTQDGDFYFGLTTITTVTYVVAGTTTVVTIS